MEAHDAVSAKIVEGAKFDGIWASSLTLSSVLGYRDVSEASWQELMARAIQMVEVTDLPVLFDGDNAYGDYNIMRQLSQRASKYGISGIVIEDKVFPKQNSFLSYQSRQIDPDQFCGMIKAGKDHQTHSDFSIIARTETLILKGTISEALDRCHRYISAGADGVVIHSKSSDGEEVLDFLSQWNSHAPVVVIPTTYPRIKISSLLSHNVGLIIWANHMLRASIEAMSVIANEVRQDNSTENISEKIASIQTIFELFDYQELKEARKKYLMPYGD